MVSILYFSVRGFVPAPQPEMMMMTPTMVGEMVETVMTFHAMGLTSRGADGRWAGVGDLHLVLHC